jgi:hypothetical protein
MSWLSVDDIHIDIATVIWNGTDSEDWSDTLNWTPHIVPNEFQNVTIPSVNTEYCYYPTVYDTGLACKQLTLDSGVILTLSAGSGLTVKANLTIHHEATLNNLGVITINGNVIILN